MGLINCKSSPAMVLIMITDQTFKDRIIKDRLIKNWVIKYITKIKGIKKGR